MAVRKAGGVLTALLAAAILAAPLAAADEWPPILPRRATFRGDELRVVVGRPATVGQLRCNGVMVLVQEQSRKLMERESEDEDPVRLTVQLIEGSADQFVFGYNLTEATAREAMQAIGRDLVLSIDKACALRPDQRARLELAVLGESQRFFDCAEAVKSKFGEYESLTSMDQFQAWAAELRRRVAAFHSTNPFCDDSRFAKVLRSTLTPQQIAGLAAHPLDVISHDFRIFSDLRAVALREQQAKQAAAEAVVNDPARLEAILQAWEQAASQVNHLDCEFRRFRYDHTFGVEKRGTGSLAVSRDGRAVYKIAPAVIERGQPGRKVAKNGELFQVRPDAAEVWHWTGKSILRIDEKERTFEEVTLPAPHPEQPLANVAGEVRAAGEEKRGAIFLVFDMESIREFWFARPFLLGMPIAELKQRYEIKLLRQNATEVWLQFAPKQKRDQSLFRQATLILTAEGYLPKALKTVDSAGGEMVHTFTNLRLSRKDAALLPDPPDLTSYHRIPEVRVQTPR